jgi:hypothetical protein
MNTSGSRQMNRISSARRGIRERGRAAAAAGAARADSTSRAGGAAGASLELGVAEPASLPWLLRRWVQLSRPGVPRSSDLRPNSGGSEECTMDARQWRIQALLLHRSFKVRQIFLTFSPEIYFSISTILSLFPEISPTCRRRQRRTGLTGYRVQYRPIGIVIDLN